MSEDSRRRILTGPATVEEILLAIRGNGKFVNLMKMAVGLAMGTDGIALTLLGYLVPCVAADWGLSSVEEGTLSASVYGGELMGSLALGVMSDTLGRRPAFLLATMLVLLFGVSTTFATNIWWLVVFRTLVGFGAGGMEVPFDLLGEMINHKENNRVLVNVQASWALGSLFVGIAAWAVLSYGYSWRVLAFVSAVPVFAVLCCFFFILESPRWLIANGRDEDAKVVLRKIASTNGLELADMTIVREEKPKEDGGGITSLWRKPELRLLTALSCFIWWAFGVLYFGVILLSAKIMGTGDTCQFDFPVLFLASGSELVSNMMSKLYVDRIDPRLSLTANFVLSSTMTLLMPVYGALPWLLVTSFFARGPAYMTACFSWLITPELYPTEVRSTGHAFCNACTSIGAVAVSYWVASSLSNQWLAVGLSVVGVAGGLAAQALPTSRRDRLDNLGSDNAEESEPLL